jgi:hypothetical protein
MKINTKTVHAVDAFDFEVFVQEKFGVEFSFQTDVEAVNDTDHEFYVNGEVDKWDQEKVDRILAGGYAGYGTNALLNYMAKAGMIPKGNYLISLNY